MNAINADKHDRPSKKGELLWVKRLCLTEDDRDRLVSGKWLHGSLTNAAQNLLREKFVSEKGLQDTITKETSWKPVHGEFVQILHIGKSHWLTLSNKQCPSGTVRVYDSIKGAIPADTKIHHYALPGKAELELEVMDVDLQVNGDDCGLNAIATAYELCAGNDPTDITTNLVWGGHYFALI